MPDVLPSSTRALLDAVNAISSDLDLRAVLTRIVEAATRLTEARYGALGVVGRDDLLAEFITTGVSDAERAAIGPPPHGRGILGLLIQHPEPIRLDDLSTHPRSVGFPPNHPPMGSFLGVPVRIRGTVFGNLYLTEKAGGSFTIEDERMVEALASAAGFVIENARAYGISERRRRWLEASAELNEALQPPIDSERAIDQVARSVRSLTHAKATLVARIDAGVPTSAIAADPDELPVIEDALAKLSPAQWPGPDSDLVDMQLGPLAATLVPLRSHLVVHSLLVVLFDTADDRPAMDDRSLLASFADQAGLALDRAQAVQDRAELAVTSDRERIARDLHDLVIQRLFATGLQLQRAEMVSSDQTVTEIIEQAVDALNGTIRDIRGTIFELQHQNGGGSSLRADLRALTREYAPLLKFDPHVHTSGPVDSAVPRHVRDQLLPVLREALSNLARHSAADHADIQVVVDGTEVRLAVLDDGVGIGAIDRESGLRNARRRAEALGGRLEITQRTPRGTSFVWRVPLQ